MNEYQSRFEGFKKELDEYTSAQMSSLELAKEFRLTEVVDFENIIKEELSKLKLQQ